MSTIIKFDLRELRKLANDKNSCVVEKKVTQNIALQPWCLGNLKESIKNLLDYKIGKYDKEFDGILLSYKNLRVLQNVGTIRNDNSDIHFQVQADYFIFRPYVGATLTGIVNKKSTTHLALLVHRVFNVVIPRPTEEPGNKWIGTNVQEGQTVAFRIVVLDLYGALPYIRGEIDESSIKIGGPDGDDEEDFDRKSQQTLVVSYVDFDKTKPQHAQKQNGDGPHQSSTPNQTKDQQRKIPSTQKTSMSNGKANSSMNKSNLSETSMSEKSKKRQSKLLENDSTKADTSTKSVKKLRRNL